MTRVRILSLTILLVTACATAQTSWTRPRSIQDANSSCRVGLLADRAGSAWERKLAKNPSMGQPDAPDVRLISQQRLHLTLTNLTSRKIVSAVLTVHGFSDQLRSVPLSGRGSDADRAQEVSLELELQGNGLAMRDLALGRFSAITLIDITAVSFADGTVWRPESAGACSVAPSLLMLASSGR